MKTIQENNLKVCGICGKKLQKHKEYGCYVCDHNGWLTTSTNEGFSAEQRESAIKFLCSYMNIPLEEAKGSLFIRMFGKYINTMCELKERFKNRKGTK